jgi:hypothetical protein
MADFYVVCVDCNETGEVLNVGLESPVHQRVSPFPAPIEVVKPLLTPHHRFFVHDRSAGRGATAEVPVPMGPSRDIESFVRDLRTRAPDLPSHADLTVTMSS